MLDGRGSLFHQRVDGARVAQAVARGERILLVQFHFVVVAQGYGNPALSVLGGGLPKAVLGHDQDLTGLCQFDRGSQPGDPRANHQKIGSHRTLRF